MKTFTRMLIAFCLFGYGPAMQAQHTVASSGGDASGTSGSVSYTIGQIVYTTSTGSDGSVAQGVQLPYEIWLITGLEDPHEITLECIVYPNPTTSNIVLKVKNFNTENLSYHLLDINGKFLESKKVIDFETTINMVHLNPATYFLKITEGSNEIKTFKITKK